MFCTIAHASGVSLAGYTQFGSVRCVGFRVLTVQTVQHTALSVPVAGRRRADISGSVYLDFHLLHSQFLHRQLSLSCPCSGWHQLGSWHAVCYIRGA